MPIPQKFAKGFTRGAGEPMGKNQGPRVAKAEGVKAGDRNKGAKNGEHKWGVDWSDGTKLGSESGRRTDPGKGARFTSRDCGDEGVKQFKDFHDSPIAALGSKSKARKQASAEIAKIPPSLAAWISKVFYPKESVK